MAERDFAVVTGAPSGIGRELARVFARQRLRPAAPRRRGLDLSTPAGIEALYAASPRPLDVLALNAGISRAASSSTGNLHAHLQLIDLNVRGVVHLARLLSP